ncbi:MAG: TIR domain-containing protein [Lewinellaceae bacterium]|nr:TIR domain-containing protein [Phaeodactylibacter sp.]MCB9038740.1 TIR domain-containing protein [Lewinellaceae bacterium]
MSKKNKDRIFLCHANEDKEQVLSFYDKLKAAGFNPWLDKKDLLPGQHWDREIRRALQNSRFIIIFFSHHSVSKRGYVQRELKLALNALEEIPEGQIFIIPVRLENHPIPEAFRHIHYVDLFESEGFELVVNVIETEIGRSNYFTDLRDDQVYKTVELVGKTWMAENLNYDIGEGCWFYDDNPGNEKKYGRLYTWNAAKRACPPGWRLPTVEEIDELIDHFGGEEKSFFTEGAYSPLMEGGTSGFNALLGGERYSYMNAGAGFFFQGRSGYYWTGTQFNDTNANAYSFDSDDQEVGSFPMLKTFALSCRYLQAF